jgi:hypothetical protein
MSKETYRLSATDLESLVSQLNFYFQSIADRLDALEGFRGSAKVKAGLRIEDVNDDDALIHQFGNSE